MLVACISRRRSIKETTKGNRPAARARETGTIEMGDVGEQGRDESRNERRFKYRIPLRRVFLSPLAAGCDEPEDSIVEWRASTRDVDLKGLHYVIVSCPPVLEMIAAPFKFEYDWALDGISQHETESYVVARGRVVSRSVLTRMEALMRYPAPL